MNVLIIVISCLLFNCVEAKTSSACYSSQLSINCTIHQLTCENPMVISLTSVTFGYRPGCGSVGDCTNLTCCVEQTADCKIPVNQTHLLELKGGCDGSSSCKIERLKDTSTACSAHSSNPAYSVIQYNCISTLVRVTTKATPRATTPLITTQATPPLITTPPTTQAPTSTPVQSETPVASTTASTQSNADSVYAPCAASTVGGILGTLVIICVILLILQFLYFQRKIKTMNKEGTVVEHQYDTTQRRQDSLPKPIYDALDTDGKSTYINLGNYARSDSTEYYNLKGIQNLPGARGQNTKTTTLDSQSGEMYETVDGKYIKVLG
ncbi:uncharacterized protein LOC126810267 [Patella vulgata]|uniref:uncharacterized protein LOC126810267 n=1 Tax=Patella vulgata TaxID=6465 RepID=UPI00217F5E66|nr:uncharacterized protein LOC126810267 [Patella vulgata]XP_050391253.1 uncharacterized protein LOC126810267 [Patella vulgata]XP_050391254.1 uncharacterized protein LOC126810267 [Patella vulgata]XP_055955049.1 uncharacterized protein LOC126810267 [Patella vulgata]